MNLALVQPYPVAVGSTTVGRAVAGRAVAVEARAPRWKAAMDPCGWRSDLV